MLGGEFADSGARLGFRGDPVGHIGAPGLGRGDAAAGREEARETRAILAANGEGHVAWIEAEAQDRPNAEMRAVGEVLEQGLARRARVHVRVHERGHDRLARDIDAGGAGRHGDRCRRSHVRDPWAFHDDRGVLEDLAVPNDDASAIEYGDRALAHKDRRQPCDHCDCRESVLHVPLHREPNYRL